MSATKDWTRYPPCATCGAPAGKACWTLRCAGLVPRTFPHRGRTIPQPAKALAGESR